MTKAEWQRLRSLREKKQREALGLFVVEGEKVVAELLAANFPLVEIYATDEWLQGRPCSQYSGTPHPATPSPAPRMEPTAAADPPGAPGQARVVPITAEEMARASHFPTPSIVLAVGRLRREPLPAGALNRGLTLALDGVQDAGNVGTCLRIADWFALDRVVLSPDCADLFNQKVVNASMGSFARVRSHVAALPAALAGVAAGVPVLGCDLGGDDVHELPRLQDAIVVIGSEGRGLSADVAAHVTRRVTIPRLGKAESLNAAIAAAIVCDNLCRVAGLPRRSRDPQ